MLSLVASSAISSKEHCLTLSLWTGSNELLLGGSNKHRLLVVGVTALAFQWAGAGAGLLGAIRCRHSTEFSVG